MPHIPWSHPEGSKQALLAQFSEFTPGSDHDVYECGSYRIPAIYLNDWPDRYIHTNFDSAANIDPTKLLRAAFIGGASGYFLASMGEAEFEPVVGEIEIRHLERSATLLRRSHNLGASKEVTDEVVALTQSTLLYEAQFLRSTEPFIPNRQSIDRERVANPLEGVGGMRKPATGDGLLIFTRAAEPKGPLSVFGYDYFADHYGASRARSLKVSGYEGLRGSGEDYAYEILNFVDGKRNAQQIRDAVSAEYGPIPFAYVIEYLRALESIGILQVEK